MIPAYGYLCLTCGIKRREDLGKHHDLEAGQKCRDVTGDSSSMAKVGPVAERPWGPTGIIAEVEWEEGYLTDQLRTAAGYGHREPPPKIETTRAAIERLAPLRESIRMGPS